MLSNGNVELNFVVFNLLYSVPFLLRFLPRSSLFELPFVLSFFFQVVIQECVVLVLIQDVTSSNGVEGIEESSQGRMQVGIPIVPVTIVSCELEDKETEVDGPERWGEDVEHKVEPEFVPADPLLGPFGRFSERQLGPDDRERKEQNQVRQHEALPDLLVERMPCIHQLDVLLVAPRIEKGDVGNQWRHPVERHDGSHCPVLELIVLIL